MNQSESGAPSPRLSLVRRRLIVLCLVMAVGLVGYIASTRTCTAFSTEACTKPIEESSAIAPNYYWYTQQNVEAAIANSQRVVLFFYAPWCGSCSTLDDELLRHSDRLTTDTTVLRVRYDTDTYMKRRYGVITQHTLVLLDDKQQAVRTWVGGGIEEINRQLDN